MSRRHSAEKREVIPDPKFGDIVVTKFMNSVMYEGKKSTAERIVYGAFDIIEAKTKSEPSAPTLRMLILFKSTTLTPFSTMSAALRALARPPKTVRRGETPRRCETIID